MADFSSRSRFKTGNPSHRPNNAHSAKPHTNTCTTTTARCVRSYAVKSARRHSTLIIVIKERRKPNIFVRIAMVRCSAGKSASTSLFTNAAMITVHIVLTHSTNSALRNNLCDERNLPSSNFVTFIASTYSKPKILSSLRH